MTARTRASRTLAVTGVVLVLALATAGPAAAHAGDPTLVGTLHGVRPALPAGVTVGLRTTIADQLVTTNPTATPLEVLDPDGAAFLRISGAGVEGNTAAPYFHLATAPPDVRVVVPAFATRGAVPRWVPLSDGPSWEWFDPRLSPQFLQVPVGGRQDVTETEELAGWSVPLRYGDTPVAVEGAIERRPVTGRFETTLDPVPAGVSAVLGQGFVPTLSVQAAAGREVTVLGRDGRPYLRFGPSGAQVDRGSPTYRDDLLSRGRPVPETAAGWVALPGSSSTWMDTRLRFPAEDPPAEFADAEAPVEVARWAIPVTVDGAAVSLSGAIRWLPGGRPGSGSPWATVALVGAGAVLVAGGAILVLRNRRLAGGPAAGPEPDAESDPEVRRVDRQPAP